MEGIWSLGEDGSWELQEPYRTQLAEAKAAATMGWAEALLGYLEPRCRYTRAELKRALLERNGRDEGKMDIFETFVLEALSGDL
jgi:hypothetical protein